MGTINGTEEQQRQHAATADHGLSTLEIIEARIAEFRSKSAALAAERTLYLDDRQRLAAETMKRPISTKAAYSLFGSLIGSLPTFSLALLILRESSGSSDDTVFFVLFSVAAVVTGLFGAIAGVYAAELAERARRQRATVYLSALALIGLGWGGFAGAVGGVFILIVGAIVGGVLGAAVGFVTVPIFALLHSLMRQGDRIELGHVLPISLGIAGSLAALILGA